MKNILILKKAQKKTRSDEERVIIDYKQRNERKLSLHHVHYT